MFRKKSRLNPLESRKQLLLAESELNRAQLVQQWQAISAEVRSISNQAKTITSLASATATLISCLASFRRKRSAPVVEKTTWWQTILSGLQHVGAVWSEFRSHRCHKNAE
jgi:hypothetical protein